LTDKLSNALISFWQGPHQDAEKLMTVTFGFFAFSPYRLLAKKFFPDNVGRKNVGAGTCGKATENKSVMNIIFFMFRVFILLAHPFKGFFGL
jgi:hypothetical protein